MPGVRHLLRTDGSQGLTIVNRIVRPRFACSACEAFTQAALPSRPIERGRPGPDLLAHVLVSKYGDHLPLYRQSRIFERDGLDLDRSTLADWVGKSTALLEPLADVIGRHVLAGQAIFADGEPSRRHAFETDGKPREDAGTWHGKDGDGAAVGLWARREAVGRCCTTCQLGPVPIGAEGQTSKGPSRRLPRLECQKPDERRER